MQNTITMDNLTDVALQVATEAHSGQKRWNGDSYISHPKRVSDKLEGPIRKAVGFLHDTVEDTDMTLDRLRELGFPEVVVEAVDYLTKKDGVPYKEYIKKLSENEIAVAVKLADLEDNMSDLPPGHGLFKRYKPTHASLKKIRK